jgi:ankyrin repeat protein
VVKPTRIKVDWLVLNNEIEQANTTALLAHLKRLVQSGHLMTNLADEKGFNLLHHAVLKGVPGKVTFMIETCKHLQNPSPSQLSSWIDAKTQKDCFTALHFASYRTNLDAINSLLRYGANKNALTATDLNMLHVAA